MTHLIAPAGVWTLVGRDRPSHGAVTGTTASICIPAACTAGPHLLRSTNTDTSRATATPRLITALGTVGAFWAYCRRSTSSSTSAPDTAPRVLCKRSPTQNRRYEHVIRPQMPVSWVVSTASETSSPAMRARATPQLKRHLSRNPSGMKNTMFSTTIWSAACESRLPPDCCNATMSRRSVNRSRLGWDNCSCQ
jgi:hypothetical protein